MAKLYGNENFHYIVVDLLKALGHDILTTKDMDKDNQGIPDEEVLSFAVSLGRTVITYNYQDYKRLHRLFPNHQGIVICSEDKDLPALALRIHAAIEAEGGDLSGKLLRINRPNPSNKN